jgi:dihydrofolate reductase
MGNVLLEITMSLDGFIAGTNPNLQQPLGKGGERLHDWFFDRKTDRDAELLAEMTNATGAVIMGWKTYADAIDEGWGGTNPFAAPVFVLAKQAPEKVVEGFTFISDGIESALKQAEAAAGERKVLVMGGANVIQQYLKAGLIDEIHLHIASVLFGDGTRLFDHLRDEHVELERIQVIETPAATHLRFRVVK